MFVVEKVRRMTDELQTFVSTHEIFLTLEILTGNTVALFHRLKINVRAIIFDDPSKPLQGDEKFYKNSLHKEFSKIPPLTTSEAIKNFSERTGIIAIVKKPLPFFRTELPFVVNGRQLLIPIFILSPDEISAIYNRLSICQILQRYAEDGIRNRETAQFFATEIMQGLNDFLNPKSQTHESRLIAQFFATEIMQGLKSFLNPESQTLKFQFLDEAQFNFRYDFDDTAIVIQGPLVYENNYTAATLKLYRKIYPNAPIVISTWTGEATDDFREICRKNSVVLLENVPPKFPGTWNVNMQLESSFRGVEFVRENTAAKFVLKTRCDQRINKANFLTYFRNLIQSFPPFGNKLRGRIIQLEAGKWLPFRTTDYLAFGYVEDISKLYGIKRHCGENNAMTYRKNHYRCFERLLKIIDSNNTLYNYTPTASTKKLRQLNNITRRMHEVESHILKTFYEENIGAIDYDKFIETGWKFMRDYLVIVGYLDVHLDWPKYENMLQYEAQPIVYDAIDFSRWLDLYRNYKLDWV